MAFRRKRGYIWHIYWQQNGKKHGRSLGTKKKTVANQYLKEFEYKLATNQLDQQSDIALDTLKEKYLEHCQATEKERAPTSGTTFPTSTGSSSTWRTRVSRRPARSARR